MVISLSYFLATLIVQMPLGASVDQMWVCPHDSEGPSQTIDYSAEFSGTVKVNCSQGLLPGQFLCNEADHVDHRTQQLRGILMTMRPLNLNSDTCWTFSWLLLGWLDLRSDQTTSSVTPGQCWTSLESTMKQQESLCQVTFEIFDKRDMVKNLYITSFTNVILDWF
jgi:hypothetical protein